MNKEQRIARDIEIWNLNVYDGVSQVEIARRLQMSPMHVNRIIKRMRKETEVLHAY